MSKAKEKIQRIKKTLSHQEADRIPASEAFWTGFVNRCREKWGRDFDPYRYFDLDYVVVTANMDPRITPFEIIEKTGDDIVVKTGFGASIRRRSNLPMPHYDNFSIILPEQMADFGFDDPADSQRFFSGGDDQINCVGDVLLRDIPAWKKRLDSYADDFAVFGSVCEPFEYLWRIIGTQNALFWMCTDTQLLEAFIDRIGTFLIRFTDAQIKAADGKLAGMYIWGDVAYVNGMLFGAPRWREMFKPYVKKLIDLCHANDLVVIYHGCGDARDIYNDMAEIGLDAYNPLEAKAGLDVVKLHQSYKNKLAFVGNIDVRVLETADPAEIKKEVLYKIRAAKGGGWIFHSDHSVSSNVDPESYALAIKLLRQYGNYPLNEI